MASANSKQRKASSSAVAGDVLADGLAACRKASDDFHACLDETSGSTLTEVASVARDDYMKASHPTWEEIQEQVADVPFEVLEKAKSDGRTALFSRTEQNVETKRANKNRPMEITSKKPVGRFREVIQAPKRVIRDPRFESLCGSFDESRFKSSYSFLYDEQLPAERQRLQKVVRKQPGEAEEAKAHLAWIDKQLKEEELRKKQESKVTEQRSIQKQAVKEGKKPFYPKKAELKKQELVEKYKELKSSGKLEKFMAKRRKKNATKDHRFVPYRRNVDQPQ